MHTGLNSLTEAAGDETASSNILAFNLPQLGDASSLGDIASLVVSDLAVRLSGQFTLPKLVVRPARGEEFANWPDL